MWIEHNIMYYVQCTQCFVWGVEGETTYFTKKTKKRVRALFSTFYVFSWYKLTYVNSLEQPKHWTLIQTKDKWLFKSGKGPSSKFIELVDFNAAARDMIKQFALFQGHRKFKEIIHLRSIIQLKAAVANHVSAQGLSSLVAPSSLQSHATMNASDRDIWNKA